MKSSFADAAKNAEVAPVTPEVPVTPADMSVVPPAQSTAIEVVRDASVVPDNFFSNSEMEGDFDRSDIQIPRLSLVHGIGTLSENFPPGNLVYAKELDLGKGPLEITLVRMRKFFQEDLKWGSEEIPRIWNSIDEVRKAGGFLTSEKREYGEGHDYYKPVLDAQILIKGAPENTVFPFEFRGVPYALALLTMHGIAYSRTAKQFITASQFGLRTGLTGATWSLTTKREKFGENLVWFPVARQSGRNSIEFIEWAKSIMNS